LKKIERIRDAEEKKSHPTRENFLALFCVQQSHPAQAKFLALLPNLEKSQKSGAQKKKKTLCFFEICSTNVSLKKCFWVSILWN
jgi:hypothetical protein